MLQQTQVDRVIPTYRAFLRRFPTVRKLAAARRSEIIALWSGLGYNNRAVRLHQAAQEIVRKWNGTLPRSVEELEQLPGVGSYTARAIAAFAFDEPVAAIDVNHGRVVRRVFYGMSMPSKRRLDQLCAALVPAKESYNWNHALMDFGALVCKSRPRCGVCPVQALCNAYPRILSESDRVRRKNSEPFIGSDRFFRGRIVHVLRGSVRNTAITSSALWERVNKLHPILPHRFMTLLAGLERDGVIRLHPNNNRTLRVALAS